MNKKAVKTSIPALMTGVALCFVTGCANQVGQEQVMDIEKAKAHIVVNQTTLSDARAMMGAPGFVSTTVADGTKVAGFTFYATTDAGTFAKNALLSGLTFGIKSSTDQEVAKFIYLTLGPDDVVTEVKSTGYSWIFKHRVTYWNEAERELTEEEMRIPLRYDADTVYQKFWEHLAAQKGVSVDDLSNSEKYQEFPMCNRDCYLHKGAEKLYGKFEEKSFLTIPDKMEGDGSRPIY